jgi:phosphopantothenoylcysteine decarboxylase/phosphopantothenate--cysteine ligase
VTVIAGVCSIAPPAGITTIHVTSAQQMLEASLHALPADIIVAAAAVSDWKPAAFTAHKLKKGQGATTLTLTENPDILATLAQHTPRARLIIGFALETELDTKAAHAKRVRKGADWLVVNQITADNPAMGAAENKVTLLRAKSIDDWPKLPKTEIAKRLVAAIIQEITA